MNLLTKFLKTMDSLNIEIFLQRVEAGFLNFLMMPLYMWKGGMARSMKQRRKRLAILSCMRLTTHFATFLKMQKDVPRSVM